MGRCIAVALLGIGSLSLSCSRHDAPARQAADSSAIISAAESSDPAELQQLGGLEARFEVLAQRLAPTVVAVSASSQPFDSDDLLRAQDLNPEKLDSLLDRTTRMVGTGLVIDPDGYILTNEHVVGEAENVWVTTDEGKVLPALVVGTDPRADLAVIKIPASGLIPVSFNTASLRRGQWAIALGNPYGLATAGGQCISIGVVSALERNLPKLSKKENRLYSGLIQTTTTINPGNSGGPLFDINGKVIGINTAVILPEKKTNGIGFAIPITSQFLASVENLKAGREVVYAYLGVTVSTPTPRERQSAGIHVEEGVRIEAIDQGSPADTLLKEGDILTRVDNAVVRDSDQFVRLVGTTTVERPAQIAFHRDGKAQTMSLTLRKRQTPTTAITRDTRRIRWEGLLLGPVPQNWNTTGKTDQGLVVLNVSPKSRFAKEVHEGDVLTTVAGQALADVTDLQQVLNNTAPDKHEIKLVTPQRALATAHD